MLKYIALVVLAITGFYYWKKPAANGMTLPQTPRVHVAKAAVRKPRPVSSKVRASTSPSNVAPPVAASQAGAPYSYPEIQKLIANNDVCAINKLIQDISSKGEDLIYIDAFLESAGLHDLKDVIGINSPIFKAPDEKNTKPAVKFIDALVTGGVMYSSKREKGDSEKSLKQMEELAKAFPGNAAFTVFKLNLENQLGKSKTQLRETSKQLLKAQQYDTFIPNIRSQILSHKWDSEAMYLLANAVRNTLPGIYAARGIDNGALLEDAAVAEHLGNVLVDKALKSDKISMSEDYDANDYYLGNNLLDNKHPNINELNELKQPGKTQELEDDWVSYDLDVDNCDRKSFDEHFAKFRNRY